MLAVVAVAVGLLGLSAAQAALPRVDVSVKTALGTSNAPAQFLITRSGSTASNLTVYFSFDPYFSTWNGLSLEIPAVAVDGVDFQSGNGQITIPAGTNSAVLPIQTLRDGDGIEAPSKPVTLDLADDTTYQVGMRSSVVGLLDRDVTNAPRVKIIMPPQGTNLFRRKALSPPL